ncbi:uncharacterized protein K02A2.6-like [Tachysurus ichikawai]
MDIDTGAAVSLVSDAVYSEILSHLPLKPPDIVLITYTGESVTMTHPTRTYDIKYRKSELHGKPLSHSAVLTRKVCIQFLRAFKFAFPLVIIGGFIKVSDKGSIRCPDSLNSPKTAGNPSNI